MKKYFVLVIILGFYTAFDQLFAQQVVINEVMSSNGYSIADEDGDYSDWIELYNTQQTDVNITGYGLSDDTLIPFKWVIPSVILKGNDHLLIFASDKNRTEYIEHWETIINWGDVWKYRIGTSEPPTDWKNLGFDDQLWSSGPSGFGYGDNDDSTLVPDNTNSVYVRKIFTVDDINNVVMAMLHVDYDDGFVAYLNGVEIARANIGTINVPPAYNESAASYTEPLIIYGGKPNAYIIQNYQTLLQNGENVLAIQLHNYGTGSSDLTLIPFLSLGMNTVPSNPNGTHPLLDLPNEFLHTNFKLSSDGETLLLTNTQALSEDQITFGTIGPDISFGRQPDGSNNWYLFPDPTPGDSNNTQGYSGVTSEPMVSSNGGFYSTSVTVSLSPATIGDDIYFTLDGSEPTENSQIYTTPIIINSTKVLRAKSFATGLLPSNTITNTYFINFSTPLTVVSLSTNPGNLFDEEYGIYAMGDSAETSFPYFGANFWKDWERPVHIELFETNGSKGFGIDMGAKIFGGWSRGNSQKSFSLFARGQYGYSTLNYKLFDELPFTEYEAFVLRNAGNDWLSTMFRDALLTSLVDDVDIDKQDYRPAVLFINGQYWGIQNIREKVNENFLAQHHNVDPDSVDILEFLGQVVAGDSTDYLALYSFIENNSMAIPANYEYIKTKMEVDNFIRYFVSQIYFDNQDWPGSNIKYWKKSVNGKWRWILFDADFGFGIWDAYAYNNNTLQFALDDNGPGWPNPPWSTLLLRKLLINNSFRYKFINCFADYSNTIFSATVVNNKINSIASTIAAEIPRHISRWGQFDYNGWLNNVQVMRNFANQRIPYMRAHFLQTFNLTGVSQVNLSNSDTSMGKIKINSIDIETPSWSGTYFLGIPLNIIAQPKKGFRFVRWEGSSTLTSDTLTITLNGIINLNAVFEIDPGYSIPKIVFNEINYNSSLTFNPQDWIEFYNNSDTSVNISGWIFRDEEDIHSYVIPEGTILGAREYIVLCSDDTLFHPLFPDVQNYLGNFDFGISGGGELLMLLDNNLNIIDSLTYDDQEPWPTQADGHGPTLSLLNPNLENSLPQSWAPSIGYGTPGKINDVFVSVDEKNTLPPTDYSLMQNYPNPFNPSTMIRFSLPKNSYVSLKVFDVIGNEVASLVNEEKTAGNYEIEFSSIKNRKSISSGVYLYQLRANDFIQTKKMILIK